MKKTLLTCILAVFLVNLNAQIQLRGTVHDSAGDVLPGVSILIQGTTQGTVTSMDGSYSITVPDEQSVLVFTFVGMETQQITVGERIVIDVVMEYDAIGVDEVVITALGISRERKSLGYSVAEVRGEDIETVTQENIMNSLAGRVAGVAINSTGGPGASVSMVIRGASSLTSDNQPLYVVDGVPITNSLANVQQVGDRNQVDYGSAIADINPQDIESITILKGPSAAALYGSRAGNGVVLITTKSGRGLQEMRVEVTSNSIFETPYRFLDTHNKFANGVRPYTHDSRPSGSAEYPYYVVSAGDSYWVGPELNTGMMGYVFPYFNSEGVLEPRELVSHDDNFKKFFQTGITSTNGFSVANSHETLDYRLSYSNMQNRGTIPNSDLNRNSIGLTSSARVLDNLRINTSINYTNSGANNRPAGNREGNPLENLYRRVNPSINIDDLRDYWEPGMEGIQQNGPYNLVINPDGTFSKSNRENNVYFLAYELNNSFRRDRIHGFGQMEWQITPRFSFMARFAHDQYNEKRETKIPRSYGRDPNGVYGITDLYRRESNSDFLFSYNTEIGALSINASGGGNYLYQNFENRYDQTINRGGGLTVPGVWSISNISPDNLEYGSSWNQRGIYSLYSLASIGFSDAIYLDLTARNDWSSTLPADNRSYFYPSASLSILTNNIFAMGRNVSLAKIRGGWAQVGNDTDPYRLNPVMATQSPWGNLTRLSTSGTLLLPNLKPEIQTSWEIGAELAFFTNRLRLDATYYQAINENQILGIGLPPSSGYTNRQINAGQISSRGYEVLMGGTPVRSSNWNIDMNLVYTWNRTRIDELAEGYDYYQFWSSANAAAVTRVGEDVGQLVSRVVTRVNDPNSPYHGWQLKNHEGRLLRDDWQNYMTPGDNTAVIGNFNPDFQIGMQSTVSFRNWSLNAALDWRKGGQFISQSIRYMESDYLTQRWIDRTLKINHLSGPERAQYLKDNADKYLLPDGEFMVVVGGPTEELGGYPYTEGGITLSDGAFWPGVEGYYDENGNFVMVQEHLGDDGTPMRRFQSSYGWDFGQTAMFDADFVKLREISLTYRLPRMQNLRIQNASVSVYSRNIILWTKAGINVDPERAFQLEGNSFFQGIEFYNVNPWTIPVGIRLNVTF